MKSPQTQDKVVCDENNQELQSSLLLQICSHDHVGWKVILHGEEIYFSAEGEGLLHG